MAGNHMAATLGFQEIKQTLYPVEKYPFSDFHITTITAGFNPLKQF